MKGDNQDARGKTQEVYLVKIYNGVWPSNSELISECGGIGYIKRKIYGRVDLIDKNKRRVIVYTD